MSVQFRNLIFEGGGVKGIAYVGAMQVLEQRDILKDIRRAGGTSAGAINALLFALGFDIPSQRQILESTEFKKFMDDSFDVRTTDFDLSDQKKNELLQSGINGAESYFQWFEDPQEKPANRIEQ